MDKEMEKKGSNIGYCPHCHTKYYIGKEDFCILCGRILPPSNNKKRREHW